MVKTKWAQNFENHDDDDDEKKVSDTMRFFDCSR
jgi:hypothetical protein